MANKVYINYDDKKFRKIISSRDTKIWIKKILKELKLKDTSCSILFTTLEKIHELNKNFLNKDYPTDVLSFSQLEGEKINFLKQNFIGDIAICIQKATEQAKEKKYSTKIEIYFLLLHGLLHLLGHEHENDKEKAMEMNTLQNEIFSKLARIEID